MPSLSDLFPLRVARRFAAFASIALLASCTTTPRSSNPRVALVIGNAAYENAPALNNPANDATDMCAALKRDGFRTMCFTNLHDRAEFDAQVRAYVDQLTPDTVGVVFYSGHGVQAGGANFLIPTDVLPKTVAEDPLRVLYGVDELFDRLRQKPTRFQLVILDACRTELFAQPPRPVGPVAAKPLARSTLVRALEGVPKVGNGLAPIKDAPPGTMVLYATAAREAAFDGRGRNGPLTKHILANIETRDLPVRDFIERVTVGVETETRRDYGKAMTPFVYGSFSGRFCFAGCPDAPVIMPMQ